MEYDFVDFEEYLNYDNA